MDMDPSTGRTIGILILIGIGALLVFLIGCAPGHITRARRHESADAVSLCGWIGLIIWPCWIVAIIWAHTGPDRSRQTSKPKPLPEPIYDGGTAEEVEGPEAGIVMPGQTRQERWAKKVVRY